MKSLPYDRTPHPNIPVKPPLHYPGVLLPREANNSLSQQIILYAFTVLMSVVNGNPQNYYKMTLVSYVV
jgi:hypothetical protein